MTDMSDDEAAAPAAPVEEVITELSEEAVRTGLFNVASLISSTGYASLDYNEWSDSTKAVLIFYH